MSARSGPRGAAFRRLIRMKPLITWAVSIVLVLIASASFSAIETWSHATFVRPGLRPQGIEFLSAILLDFSLLAAWSALYYGINYYLILEKQTDQLLHLEHQASSAQLAMLRYQLNPHFLFNTLNSISALQMTDVEAANRMTARLGDFLRLTLDNVGTQEVTLRQEMEFLRSYLEIERIRFQDRLVTRVDVPHQALDAKVPNLILQPIVENAIRHGIAPRSTPGLIEIGVEQQNGTLRIQVRDNGPGLSEHRTAENLFQRGLGLANTETRLERLYGADHLFDFRNNPAGGLVVTLEIPFHAKPSRQVATP